MDLDKIKSLIRDIKDFPKPGIVFKDITPILKNPSAIHFVIKTFCEYYKDKNIHKIASMESRGFIFGSILAYELSCGFIPVRKKGKLPYKTISIEYSLEYGTDILEIHEDAVSENENVLIIDDVLATGGTANAVIKLIEKSKGKVVGVGVLVELTYLNPRERLKGYDVFSLIQY